jgi:V/A-type H+-transporting ATPase subunit D
MNAHVQGREGAATRIALLELREERRLIEEGYSLLDEKRLLLAAEIRGELGRWRAARERFRTCEARARARLGDAVARHGLDELAVYPPVSLAEDGVSSARRRLFGLELVDATWRGGPESARHAATPLNPSPEARACAEAFRLWLPAILALAASARNLRVLLREYVSTERRARAIENVLLPEVNQTLRRVEEQLEGADQEELARLRARRERPP